MRHYIGIDVSNQESAICIIDEKKEVLIQTKLCTCPEIMGEFIRKFIEAEGLEIDKIGIEAGNLSRWLVQGLQNQELPAVCICPRVMHALLEVNTNKNDKNDAKAIADAMRINKYKEVHTKSDISAELAGVLSARGQLVKNRTDTMNNLRGNLKSFGIKLPSFSAKSAKEILKPLLKRDNLADAVKTMIRICLKTIEQIDEGVEIFNKMIDEAVKERTDVKLLRTIPGVGPITALQFICEIDDYTRFTASKSVGAYVGLTPREFSSGERVYFGRISRRGNSDLRCLLYEAAVTHLTRYKFWTKDKAWAEKLRRKHGIKKAATALARKLAVTMHHMLETKKPYDPVGKSKKAEEALKKFEMGQKKAKALKDQPA